MGIFLLSRGSARILKKLHRKTEGKLLIDELVQDTYDKIMKSIEGGREEYKTILTEILARGHKGYENMTNRALINLYLEKKNQVEFMALLEKVENQL